MAPTYKGTNTNTPQALQYLGTSTINIRVKPACPIREILCSCHTRGVIKWITHRNRPALEHLYNGVQDTIMSSAKAGGKMTNSQTMRTKTTSQQGSHTHFIVTVMTSTEVLASIAANSSDTTHSKTLHIESKIICTGSGNSNHSIPNP